MARASTKPKPKTSRKPKPKARPASSRKPAASRKAAPATSRKPVSSRKTPASRKAASSRRRSVFEMAYDVATSSAGAARVREDISKMLQRGSLAYIATHPEPILAALATSNPPGIIGDALRASLDDLSPGNVSAHLGAKFPNADQVEWLGTAMYDLGRVTPEEVPSLLYRWVSEEAYAECMAVWAAEAQELYRSLGDRQAPSLLHTPGASRPPVKGSRPGKRSGY